MCVGREASGGAGAGADACTWSQDKRWSEHEATHGGERPCGGRVAWRCMSWPQAGQRTRCGVTVTQGDDRLEGVSGSGAEGGGNSPVGRPSNVSASAAGVSSSNPVAGTSNVRVSATGVRGGDSVTGASEVLGCAMGGGGCTGGAPSCWRTVANCGRCPGLNRP